MREHLRQGKDRVVVVHCKAGKGRSGTMSCAYLISEEEYSAQKAMKAFTTARMRPGWGEGVSIPSQRRWLRYVEAWKGREKRYVDRRVRVHTVHIWGLRAGVRVAVQGFVEEGREIKTFHAFTNSEKADMTAGERREGEADVILTPAQPLTLPSSDLNIDFERRTHAKYGLTMVTSVAHVWFNVFFESQEGEESGVFEIVWNEMDGIKGTSRKGMQALDKLQVVWSVEKEGERVIEEPKEGEPVMLTRKAHTAEHEVDMKELGIRHVDSESSQGGGSDILGDISPFEASGGGESGRIITGISLGAGTRQVEGIEEPKEAKEARIGALKIHGGEPA